MIHENFGKGRNVLKPNDNIYTPEQLAKYLIKLYDLQGKVLDPFKGGGAFYNNLPKHTTNYWCEIDENKDFTDWNEPVDWIISNPPYSIYSEVMKHSMKIADNIVYLVPLSKVVSSLERLREISSYGGIVSIYWLGASRCGFPFGFPACSIHIKRNYKGPTEIKEIPIGVF
jgi:hypothetical protein